jgi:uncharacterized protein
MRIALQAGLFVLVFLLAAHVLARMSLYHPMRYPDGYWDLRQRLGAEDVALTAGDGVRLHAWWAPSGEAALATLFLHGNAGNVTHRGTHIEQLRRAGSAVLVVDYRGYGRSEGSPSEEGLLRDARAGYEWLLAQGWSASRIVMHGESLGSTVAVLLAAEVECGGVVLEAPFPSVQAVAGGILPFVGPLVARGFNAGARDPGDRRAAADSARGPGRSDRPTAWPPAFRNGRGAEGVCERPGRGSQRSGVHGR